MAKRFRARCRRRCGDHPHGDHPPPGGDTSEHIWLVGAPAATPWDPALAATLRTRDMAVEEELMLDKLLAAPTSG